MKALFVFAMLFVVVFLGTLALGLRVGADPFDPREPREPRACRHVAATCPREWRWENRCCGHPAVTIPCEQGASYECRPLDDNCGGTTGPIWVKITAANAC